MLALLLSHGNRIFDQGEARKLLPKALIELVSKRTVAQEHTVKGKNSNKDDSNRNDKRG